MLAHGRGADLPQSISSETDPNISKHIIDMMLIIIPKPFENHRTLESIIKNIMRLQMLVSRNEANCLVDSWPGAFVCNLLFGSSEGAPLDRFWTPLEHPRFVFLDLFNDMNNHLTRIVQDFRATFRYFINKWCQPYLQQNKQWLNIIPIISRNKFVLLLFDSYRNHANPNPEYLFS